jgi:hypothetical protein
LCRQTLAGLLLKLRHYELEDACRGRLLIDPTDQTEMSDADKKHAFSTLENSQIGPPDKKRRKRQQKQVQFYASLVDKTMEAPDYDRTAVLNDTFTCDICGIRIPCGIKGYEPFATCAICDDGYDVCGQCCGVESILTLCRKTVFSPEMDNPGMLLRIDDHPHDLQVVDRSAEIVWANDGAVYSNLRGLPTTSITRVPRRGLVASKYQ